jgi:iron complex outermembrane recepter protein
MKSMGRGLSAVRMIVLSGGSLAAIAASPAVAQDAGGDMAEPEMAEPAYAEPAFAEPAFAEQAASANDEGAYRGNDIVVTATKRAQSLQDVPVAVSVTTETQLERAEIRDLKDLTTEVPTLRVTQLQSSANTNFIIRGFGNGANNAGIEPSVGVFVDNVYRSRSAARINDLPDLERIEVLSGPQSTLFGKNASAGVISVTTAEPKFQFGGQAEVSYGNYDAMVAKGIITGPITDTVAASIAGGINKRDGYIHDEALDQDTNERNRWFTRGQLLFEPNDLFKIRLIGDYEKTDEDCCATVLLQNGFTGAAVNAVGGQFTDPADPYADVSYSNFASTNEIENWGFSGQIDYGYGPFGITSITAYRGVDAVTNQDSDFTSADLISENSQDLAIRTFTQELRLTGEFGPANILLGAFYFNESIDQTNNVLLGSDFRGYADLLIRGQTAGAFTADTVEQTVGALLGDPTQFIGEFFGDGQGLDEAYTLDNEAISIFGQVDFEVTDRLTLTAGLNYTKDNKKFTTDTYTSDTFSTIDLVEVGGIGIYQQALSTTIGDALMLGRPATAAEIGAFAGANPAAFGLISAGSQAYADANAANPDVNPLLALQALQFLPPFQNVPNSVESGKIKDDDLAFTLRAAYDLSDSVNLYVSYATGYKPPSVNLSRDSRPTAADRQALIASGEAVPNLTAGGRYANAEESEVFEFGIKGNWGLAQVNFAAFRQSIKDFQSNIFTGTGFLLANAGEQRVTGFEFDGTMFPVEPLMLRLALTYLDAEYVDFPVSGVGDLSGTQVAGVPPISLTASAQYTHEFGNGSQLIARGAYHYESEVQVVEGLPGFIDLGQEAAIGAVRPFPRQVDDVSASLTWVSDMGLEMSVWGRNLLNDRYLLSIFDTPIQPLSFSGYPNQPRTYGITARYKF